MGQKAAKEENVQDNVISKKLVNNPTQCVKESLQGYVLTHDNVKLLEGHDVVVRADLRLFRESGKVAVITGQFDKTMN